MEKLRVLTTKGTEEFIDYINQVRQDPSLTPPIEKLSHYPYSKEFVPSLEIEIVTFTNRMDFGKYLAKIFDSDVLLRTEIASIAGLWSWLALLWFDILCPKDAYGNRKVREASRYVCSTDYTDFYRHLVASTWDIYSTYGEKARLFLHSHLYEHNDFIEQLASRMKIFTNRSLIEVFDRLYWDNSSESPKKGAQSKNKAGSFRRLISFIKQIDLTYDLHSMSAENILELLPIEYNYWKSK